MKSNAAITELLITYCEMHAHAGDNQPHWTDNVSFDFESNQRKLFIGDGERCVIMNCLESQTQWEYEGSRGLLSKKRNERSNLQPVWDWLQSILQQRIDVYAAHHRLTRSQEARDHDRFDVALSAYLRAYTAAPDAENVRDGFDITWYDGLQKLIFNPIGSLASATFERVNGKWSLDASEALTALCDNSGKSVHAYATDLLKGRTQRLIQQAQPVVSCRSDEGVTQGLVDSIITLCRVLRHRDLSPVAVQEALRDLAGDEDFAHLKAALEEATAPARPESWS